VILQFLDLGVLLFCSFVTVVILQFCDFSNMVSKIEYAAAASILDLNVTTKIKQTETH